MDFLQKTGITLAKVGESLGIHNLDPNAGKIFVSGGTGVIGHRVAVRLLKAGYPSVRLGAQSPDDLADLNKLGAEIADFAWDREDSYDKALDGVTSVLCTIPYTNMWYKHFPVFLEACRSAGVKHFVKLSFYHARVPDDAFQEVPLVREHGDCDDQLIKMVKPDLPTASLMGPDLADIGLVSIGPNMSYTILYASHFMSNPFTFQGRELRSDSMKPATYYGASHNRGINYVSPNDVAECAVRALVAPKDHYNKEYTLTGPEAISDQQVADLFSKYLRKPIMYVDQPLHEYTKDSQLSGDPKWMVDDKVSLEKIKGSGTEENVSFVTADIQKICGHDPESFEEYLLGTEMMTPVEAGPPSELKPLKGIIAA